MFTTVANNQTRVEVNVLQTLADEGVDELRSCLAEMERAAGLVGAAMLRP